MKVTVGVISHNPGELFQRCMQSLINIPAGVPYGLLLQLTEGSNAENWNRLFERFDSDFLCILEDDTAALKPFWLKSLVETMRAYPEAGIVMPIETKDGEHEDPGFTHWLNKTMQVEQTFGFCNLIRKGVELKADENLTYFVDIDLAYQSMSHGWKNMVNGHVWMLHGAPQGRMSTAKDIQEAQKKDMEYLAHKWAMEEQRQEAAKKEIMK